MEKQSPKGFLFLTRNQTMLDSLHGIRHSWNSGVEQSIKK